MASYITRRLKETFGEIPRFIEENIKYLSYDEECKEFSCNPCNKIMKKIEGNEHSTLANFESHLLSRSHVGVSISVTTLRQSLEETFHGKIPQLVLNNVELLGMVEQNYLCVICDKQISVNKYIEVTERNFLQHLLSRTHLDGLNTFRGILSQVADVFGGVPEVVQNNQAYLEVSRSGRSYACVLCKKKLMVHPTDLEETEHNFKKHLYSLKHIEHRKQDKGFGRLPQLKVIYDYNELPNYILRSIEYISFNGRYFFCSLCNKNVKFVRNDIYLSEQCLRLHMLGDDHRSNLNNRKDNDENEVYNMLKSVFATFEDDVVEDFETLSLIDGSLGCGLCCEVLEDDDDLEQTKWNIMDHFGNDGTVNHADRLQERLTKNSDVRNGLVDVFGGLPDTLTTQNNLSYIEYRGRNEFVCVPCEAILQAKNSGDDYETNEQVTEVNFRKHLTSKKHFQWCKESIIDSDMLNDELEMLCSAVPQFILSNWDNIWADQSAEEFSCRLCDVTISVTRGPKSAEITLLNLRTHLLSPKHSEKLKTNAAKEIETEEQLKAIFGGIPEFILANIDHIYRDSDGFFCYTCDARLEEGSTSLTTEVNFRKHLSGSRHRKAVGDADSCHQEAFRRLDSFFPRIPEFLLRQLDFLKVFGNDLHCALCQHPLPIDCLDLIYTRELLRSHMDSEKHIYNLSNL